MNPKKAYKYCFSCGHALVAQKGNVLACFSCSRHTYINPFPTNGVIIENKKGEILLVRRAFAPFRGWWDVPGGFIQPRESIERSIKREVKEELNITVSPKKLIGIYTDTYLFEGVINYTLCIIATADFVDGVITAADDASEWKFFSKTKLPFKRIAFKGVRKGLADYLSSTLLPNFSA
ncbi:MAG TPA: NUDIX domain-containing protein [Patescibacteria group bacterium]|nr:NUDIX domain-containing protein [Patescibacteria group bacterium]